MVRRMRAAWYGQISLIDAQLGRVLEVLERRGLLDSTLVVFTSDHGDYLGDNWAYYKYREPSTIRCRGCPSSFAGRTGGVPAGAVTRDLACLLDLAPTFLAAAGLDPVDEVDGIDLLPRLRGEAGTGAP